MADITAAVFTMRVKREKVILFSNNSKGITINYQQCPTTLLIEGKYVLEVISPALFSKSTISIEGL